jgi:hypothetical protein
MIYFPMLLACSALLQVIIKIPPGPPKKKHPKKPNEDFNSTYFSRSTPSFVWKILFLAQIFYTAS